MIQRVGGAHALGLSIGVIVGCVTILILIFSGRLIIGPAFAVGAIREARYDGPLFYKMLLANSRGVPQRHDICCICGQ